MKQSQLIEIVGTSYKSGEIKKGPKKDYAELSVKVYLGKHWKTGLPVEQWYTCRTLDESSMNLFLGLQYGSVVKVIGSLDMKIGNSKDGPKIYCDIWVSFAELLGVSDQAERRQKIDATLKTPSVKSPFSVSIDSNALTDEDVPF